MGFNFLEAFVQFSAKGMETVLSAADKIQEKIKSTSGNAGVEFKSTGAEKVQADATHIKGLLGELIGRGEVKFTASGLNSVEGAINTIKQRLAGVAQGGDLTRMLSGGIAEAFQAAGTQAGGLLVSGMGAAIGGAMGGAIGAMLGNTLSSLPSAIGGGVKFVLDTHESQGQLRAGAKTSEEADQWDEVRQRMSDTWGGSKLGVPEVMQGLDTFEIAGVSPEAAEKALNRIMTLRVAGAEVNPEAYARMLAGHSPRQRMAAVRSSVPVMNALREMFPEYAKGDEEQGLLPAVSSGKIGTADIEEAYHRASLNPQLAGRAQSVTGAGNISAFSRSNTERFGRMFTNPEESKMDWLTFPFGSMVKTLMSPGISDLSGMESAAQGPWSAHPELSSSKEYSFTSLAGLAEKMQQEASGGGDVQDQQLNELRQIKENTKSKIEPEPAGSFW